MIHNHTQHPTLQYYWWFLLYLLWMRIKIFFTWKKNIKTKDCHDIYIVFFFFGFIVPKTKMVRGNSLWEQMPWYAWPQLVFFSSNSASGTDWLKRGSCRSPSACSCWAPWSRFLSTRLSFPGWSLGYPWQTRSAPWPSRFSLTEFPPIWCASLRQSRYSWMAVLSMIARG